MTRLRRAVSSRLCLLALAIGCVAMQFPAASAGFVDPDFAEEHGSRPMPRPDSPGAANAFRQLQWNNEFGWFPEPDRFPSTAAAWKITSVIARL